MADSTVAATLRSGSWRAITGYQWLVFVVVWLGWTLDAADFGLFSLVLQRALRNLLGFASTGVLPPEQMAQIGKYGGLLIMTGLLGWAAGGFIFGILADYIGRVRALMFSIGLYRPGSIIPLLIERHVESPILRPASFVVTKGCNSLSRTFPNRHSEKSGCYRRLDF